MITLKIERATDGITKDITDSVQQPITLTQRLDRELDSGSFDYLKYDVNCSDSIDAPLSNYRVTLSDGENEPVTVDFIGTDSRTLLRGKFGDGNTRDTAPLFRHSVMLTEPTKLLEGMLIDGFAVTQPEDQSERKSLRDVIVKLLKVASVGRLSKGTSKSEQSHVVAVSNLLGLREGYIDINTEETNGAVGYVQITNLQSNATIINSSVSITGSNSFRISLRWYSLTNNEIEVELSYLVKFRDCKYLLTGNKKTVSLLQKTISPQFKWSTQTTLWECLCDIGSVIDAIPRLVASDENKFVYVDFDLVNDKSNEIGQLLDERTIDYGEEVDDSQFNTQLRSVVENIKEE